MSSSTRASNSQYHVHSLHEYVLAPLSAATSRVDRDRAELAAERDAFREFRERAADIETTPASSTPRRIAAGSRGTHSEGFNLVRSAYRETVMDVPHYEDVYDEPLTDHVAAEFGSKLARQLQRPTSFTVPLRETLRAAAQRAIDERRRLLDRLDEEAASLETAQSEITEVLVSLSSTVIPEWHRESFTRQLDAIAEQRQETLHARGDLPDGSDYSLSTYLYGDAAWIYPVLTSVARVRETVTLDEPTDRLASRGIREST